MKRQLTLRKKLLWILLLSLSIGLISVNSIVYFRFKAFLYNSVEEVLYRDALLIEQSLDPQILIAKDRLQLAAFVRKFAAISNCRVTLILPDGSVIADSEVSLDRIDRLDNHAQRPEVLAAEGHAYGFSMRQSNTLNRELLYLSRKIATDDQQFIGYLRLALFAEQTDAMLATARILSVISGLIIGLFSAILVILLTRKINQNLDEVIIKAERIAAGDLDAKLNIRSTDELSRLGHALNSMSRRLSRNLKRLSRERRDLNAVISSIHEGIIAVNSKKNITFYNDFGLQFLAQPVEKSSKESYRKVFRFPHLVKLVDRFFERDILIHDEIITPEEQTFEVVINPVRVSKSATKGAVIVLRDMTQFKRLEKIRTDFVANVSHEFKTPLAAIRGYGETLLDWALDDGKVSKKYVERIIKQSRQLENLVTDLLHLARIEKLQNIELSAIHPGPIITDILRQYAEIAQERKISLTNELDNDILQPVCGDPEMFRSVLTNLIDNAIKYTADGGKVSVSAHTDPQSITFQVEDDGMGIPEKKLDRIFQRFYRVDKGRSRSIGGTGLGLSIVKHLCEIQQATVWVASEVNVGSRFFVKFGRHLTNNGATPPAF